LYMVASDAVLLLLGERWQMAIPLIRTLALISVFSALSYASSYLLLALGRVSLQAFISWLRLGLLAFLAITMFPEAGAQGIAHIRLATTALGFVVFMAMVLHYVEGMRLSDFLEYVWRPVFSTGIMSLALSVIPKFEFLPLILQVAFSVSLGAVVYACAILILWRISGCTDGAETYLLEQLRMKDRILKWRRVPE